MHRQAYIERIRIGKCPVDPTKEAVKELERQIIDKLEARAGGTLKKQVGLGPRDRHLASPGLHLTADSMHSTA